MSQSKPALNAEQRTAVDSIIDFLSPDCADDFFLLLGPAGTGKTFCIASVIPLIKGRLVFTAPTNKATKCLRESVTSKDYTPDCRTIYSLLGLKLEANGEVKELTAPEDPLDLTKFAAVVVDEGSMISSTLWKHIQTTAQMQGVKFIVMGDAAQLPPVGELHSPVFRIERRAELTTVMRHDNQILTLATELRKRTNHPAPNISLTADNDGEQGVWLCTGQQFHSAIADRIAIVDDFTRPDGCKVIAWRNATVDSYNAFIRQRLFPETHTSKWLAGDRIILTGPAKDLDGETIGTTDDEGTIEKVYEGWHPHHEHIKIWNVTVTLDTNKVITLRVLHDDSFGDFTREKADLAESAKVNRRLWRKFWEFVDAFHGVRHAYAITAHRAQGSTYDTAFVDYRDILQNRNRQEAFRCLYVAETRAKRRVYLG